MDDWIEKAPVIVEAWYPGMEGGHAIADILFGDINPSGKLPLTFPKKLSDSPAHKSISTFPGVDLKVHYDEGIYVGYRHFDKEEIEPLFPFGFGLSYTTFGYENLKVSATTMTPGETLSVSVDVVNSGDRAGTEIVQLYIADLECRIDRPPKELKGFARVPLNPQERQTVRFSIESKDLAFYNDQLHDWAIEPGQFTILIGSSSRNIHLHASFDYTQN